MLEDDPGWGFSWQTLLLLIPYFGLFYRRRLKKRAQDGLIMLRQLFTSFCVSIVLFGVVLAFLYPSYKQPRHPRAGVALGLLVAGAASALFGPRIEQPLNCTDDARLAGSYRTRFFLRIAFSEVAALFGFVAFFLTYLWWTYPVGAAITALGFRRAAPTSARLGADQQVLIASGCSRSLVGALRTVRPPDAGRPRSDSG